MRDRESILRAREGIRTEGRGLAGRNEGICIKSRGLAGRNEGIRTKSRGLARREGVPTQGRGLAGRDAPGDGLHPGHESLDEASAVEHTVVLGHVCERTRLISPHTLNKQI